MCNINNPKFPCRICAKNAHDQDKAVLCDLFELWIYIKCNKLNYLHYRYLQNYDESWYCIECCSTFSLSIPYLATQTSWLVVQTLIVTSHSGKDLENYHNSSL